MVEEHEVKCTECDFHLIGLDEEITPALIEHMHIEHHKEITDRDVEGRILRTGGEEGRPEAGEPMIGKKESRQK